MTLDRLDRPVNAPAPSRTAAAVPRPASAAARFASTIGNRAMSVAVTGASALRRAILAGPRPAWANDAVASDAGPRAPWDRARRQQAALDALARGRASARHREFLIEEIRRQVPDVAYMEQVAAGARTVVTLIFPGNGPLGLKTLNDDLVGYQINNLRIVQERNKVVRNAFRNAGGELGAAFAVTEQTYKMTTVTSDLSPPQLHDAMQDVLRTIDRDVRDVYLRGLQYGLRHWKPQRASRNDDESAEATRRVANIRDAIAKVETPGFQLDFQFGIAAIERGAGAPDYAEALTAHLRASQAALMSREHAGAATPELVAGRPRGQIYDRDAFVRFSEEGESLRRQIIKSGNTLTYRDRAHPVFVGTAGAEASRDVLRDVRKAKVKEEDLASDAERDTLRLFQRYFLHINAFDNLRDFTSAEVEPVGEQIECVQRLIDRLRNEEPVAAPSVAETLHENPAMSEVVPRQDTASEAVFYNAGRSRTHRIIVSCDIRDMGVDVAQHYGKAMYEVGSEGKDPDVVAQRAADQMVRFRRQAIRGVRERYRALVQKAIKDKQGSDPALALALEAELEPSLLMGGDEITLSLHEGLRPYLPQLATVLMDPSVSRARVAISTTGGSLARTVKHHIRAQERADPAHSVLKEFEAEHHDLELRVHDIDDTERADRAADLMSRLGLSSLYAANEGAGIVLRNSETGEDVDSDKLRERIAAVKRELRVLGANRNVVTR